MYLAMYTMFANARGVLFFGHRASFFNLTRMDVLYPCLPLSQRKRKELVEHFFVRRKLFVSRYRSEQTLDSVSFFSPPKICASHRKPTTLQHRSQLNRLSVQERIRYKILAVAHKSLLFFPNVHGLF